MKTCTRCQLPKDLDEFVKDNRRADGHGSWCLLCNRAYSKGLYQRPDQKSSKRKYYENNRSDLCRNNRRRWSVKRDQYMVAVGKWRLDHRDQLLADYRQRGKDHRKFTDSLKEGKPCLDCGNIFPPYCMEFDHITGEKRFALGAMSNHRRSAVEIELAKCELICCACHRVRTNDRRVPSSNPKVIAFREWLRPLKSLPCLDCGKSLPSVAMDFDHVFGDKLSEITQMWSWRRDHVLVEIGKCELVCANCHRIRTQARKILFQVPLSTGLTETSMLETHQ